MRSLLPSLRVALAGIATLSLASLVACGDDTSASGGGGNTTTSNPSTTSSQGGAGGNNEGGAIPDGCVEITQSEVQSTYFSVDAVGFGFAPAMAGSPPEVIVVSPNENGPFSPQKAAITGLDGSITVFAIEDAVVDLINAPDGAMDRRIFLGIAGIADLTETPDYGTQFQGRITGTLENIRFQELDNNSEVLAGGDCLFLRKGVFDASNFDTQCNAQTDVANVPSAGACFADYIDLGHDCNPVTNDGCLQNEVCDLGVGFTCFPLVGDEVGLCQSCDNQGGPLCGVGQTCDSNGGPGECHRYCCTDADCGGGGRCIAYFGYGMGVCMTP